LNARTALLGLFVLLTLVLASTTVYESGSKTTVTSTSTLTRTSTVTQTSTFATVATITTVTTMTTELTPFADPLFMVPPARNETELSFGADINDAIQFSCGYATEVTCTGVQFIDSATNTTTTILMTYPQIGQPNEPLWANCTFESSVTASGISVYLGQGYGYCVQVAVASSLSSNGTYIIAQPAGYTQPPA
jgi:hypothetical protein